MATINIVEKEEEFLLLKDFWNGVYSHQRNARIFQSFEWNYHGWRLYHKVIHPDEKLYILKATRDGHDDQRLIVPLCLSARGELHFICQDISDVLDAVVPMHVDSWNNLLSDVVDYIQKDSRVKSINLFNMEGDSEFLHYLGVYLQNPKIGKTAGISFFNVVRGQDFFSGLPALTSKERSYLKSIAKKFADCEFKIFSRQNGDEFPASMILDLRDRMCENGSRALGFFKNEEVFLLSKMYECDLCEISTLVKNDRFEEASVRFLQPGNRINFGTVLYTDRGMTTTVDIKYMIEKSALSDCLFDFGVGTYSYKLGTFRPNVSLLYRVEQYPCSILRCAKDLSDVVRTYIRSCLPVSSVEAIRSILRRLRK